MKSKQQIDYTQFQHKPFKFMLFVAREYKTHIIVKIALVILAEAFYGISFYAIKELTDSLNSFSVSGAVNYWAILLLTFFAATLILYRISGLFGGYITTHLEADSFEISFKYIMRHSYRYFSDRLVGKLSSKVSNIARSVESIFPMIYGGFLRVIVKFISFSVLAFWLSGVLGFIFGVFILFFVVFNLFVSQKLAHYSKIKAEKISNLRGNVVDNLTNMMAVHQNVKIKSEIERISSYIKKYRFWHWKTWRYFESVLIINSIMIVSMFGTAIFSALHLWKVQMIETGAVIVVITMTTSLAVDLMFMGDIFNRFMQNYGQLKEGLEEIFTPHEIVDEKNAKKVKIEKGEIIFDKVAFHYEEDKEQLVFKNLSLKIPTGQKIGLVGESGAGKSTFVSLLLRFMDVENGSIKIDGYDIKKIRQDDLRGAIAYVPQEALLFHRTLEENIKYSDDKATKEDVLRATKRAYALDFIKSFPKEFETLVGERGVKLSGGQKQRVMIARAMLKKSPILVLDEATSSLDSKAEKLIQKALEELMKNRTTIIIAHRLSTLKKMDRIIVFDNGKIVEDGTHKELLSKKGKYFNLWRHQVGEQGN